MIKNIYIEPSQNDFKLLSARPTKNAESLEMTISKIFDEVQKSGDQALRTFSKLYDHVDLDQFEISKAEIKDSIKSVPLILKDAIKAAKGNITKFHKTQISKDLEVETMDGVICMQKSIGIERVGIYIPGGTAPLFSTVLMLAIPAQIAGCKEVVLCTPPDAKGEVNPAILFAASLCGVTKLFKVGGAQAIAAMALGTESIPSVYKIFGPGNQYVTAAKQYAQKYGVAMDSPAGPSELLVYADETSIPAFVAADLLSQAEHGVDSQVILVTDNQQTIDKVNAELTIQIDQLPRKSIAVQALATSKMILLSNTEEAFQFINEYGPEHLILATIKSDELVDEIVNAGSVFMGNYCPESAGDYASGTNHTLPTNGWTKSFSGVNVDSFAKKITFQKISKTGIQNIGGTIIEMATHEKLYAHAQAVQYRLDQLKNVSI